MLAAERRPGAIGFEEIATIPRPGAQGLSQVHFSPDDRYVTFLGGEPTSLTRELYAYDRVAGGAARPVMTPPEGVGEEGTMSKEEQLRRERARLLGPRPTAHRPHARCARARARAHARARACARRTTHAARLTPHDARRTHAERGHAGTRTRR